jgi:hypothetical protein
VVRQEWFCEARRLTDNSDRTVGHAHFLSIGNATRNEALVEVKNGFLLGYSGIWPTLSETKGITAGWIIGMAGKSSG